MSRVLIYILRRDLRLADNPVFHEISKVLESKHQPFTKVLPIYIVPAQQIETSGFLKSDDVRSPYPAAKSAVGQFWRCGPRRAKFLSESLWDLKKSLEDVGSGLVIRIGLIGEVLSHLLAEYKNNSSYGTVHGVWMTGEEGYEEKGEEQDVRSASEEYGVEFKLWTDEKYFVHDRDVPLDDIKGLPNVFSKYKNMVEPLRDIPRPTLPKPGRCLPLPEHIPPQKEPFRVPELENDFAKCLMAPVEDCGLQNIPTWPKGVESAHPFRGGEREAHKRVQHYISGGHATVYKDTRNGMLGSDFSTKFSAWLALGCISARQIHKYLLDFEDGTTPLGKGVHGYGKGENKGTGWVRFELLWRDYFRLCTRKFGSRLFHVAGFKGDTSYKWKSPDFENSFTEQTRRWLEGRTGLGLIDASQRELILTGYTSNRARQNVASFLSKHLGIDWRIGAEWYEYCLVDYDVSSNWGNWQYTAGVGNDPRESRQFNPVKQAFDYDPDGSYVKAWVEELRPLDKPDWIFQPGLMSKDVQRELDLIDHEMVQRPLKTIQYSTRRSNQRGGMKKSPKQHAKEARQKQTK